MKPDTVVKFFSGQFYEVADGFRRVLDEKFKLDFAQIRFHNGYGVARVAETFYFGVF